MPVHYWSRHFNGLNSLFVNDCTPDSSIRVLENVLSEYPQKQSQVTILHHEKNRGVASARNTGLKKACGDYILVLDSDDWADPTMTEDMYSKALANDSDMVWCDFYVDFLDDLNKSSYSKQIAQEIHLHVSMLSLPDHYMAQHGINLLKEVYAHLMIFIFPQGFSGVRMMFLLSFACFIQKISHTDQKHFIIICKILLIQVQLI